MYYKSDQGPVRVPINKLSAKASGYKSSSYKEGDKKPWYKSVLFWVILVAIILLIIYAVMYSYKK